MQSLETLNAAFTLLSLITVRGEENVKCMAQLFDILKLLHQQLSEPKPVEEN